jgi:NAD(P)-dependent dehydrogenase (short-subunit alcohol dehydrogenase family)
MNVNVRGTIDLIRQVLPHMAKTEPLDADGERGIVIMVASSAAFDGQPGQGMSSISIIARPIAVLSHAHSTRPPLPTFIKRGIPKVVYLK